MELVALNQPVQGSDKGHRGSRLCEIVSISMSWASKYEAERGASLADLLLPAEFDGEQHAWTRRWGGV